MKCSVKRRASHGCHEYASLVLVVMTYMRKISRHTRRIHDIITRQLIDERRQLEQETKGLADAAGGSEDGHLVVRRHESSDVASSGSFESERSGAGGKHAN